MSMAVRRIPSFSKSSLITKGRLSQRTFQPYSTLIRKHSSPNLVSRSQSHLQFFSPSQSNIHYDAKRPMSSSGRGPNDRQLHDSFNGLLPRLLSLQTLFKPKGRETFSELFLNDIIVTEQLFTGIKLFTDLQNPLLEKYNFNVRDFFNGTKEAFISIQKAITTLHFMNNGLFMERKENYQLEEMNSNLLRTTLDPALYSIIDGKLQEKIDPISAAFEDYQLQMDDLSLNSIIIEHIETKLNEADQSVFAIIDVSFESEQIYEHNENKKKPKVKRTIASNWKFAGCISGHIPLQWTVLTMKNYIKQSSLLIDRQTPKDSSNDWINEHRHKIDSDI